jgi:hypothetical protein
MRSKKHVSKAQASSGAPAKTSPESAPAPAAFPGEVPDHQTMVRLREELLRRLRSMIGTWRTCPARSCARQHRCVSPAFECETLARRQELSSEESAEAMVEIRQGLDRRLAELRDEER